MAKDEAQAGNPNEIPSYVHAGHPEAFKAIEARRAEEHGLKFISQQSKPELGAASLIVAIVAISFVAALLYVVVKRNYRRLQVGSNSALKLFGCKSRRRGVNNEEGTPQEHQTFLSSPNPFTRF